MNTFPNDATESVDNVGDGNSVSYSLENSLDAAAFDINASTGAVAFKSAPSHSNPVDADQDNVYTFTVEAKDDYGSVRSRQVEVTVIAAPVM